MGCFNSKNCYLCDQEITGKQFHWTCGCSKQYHTDCLSNYNCLSCNKDQSSQYYRLST